MRIVPESADPSAPGLDFPGAVVSTAGLIAIVYSIIEAPTHGWTASRTLLGLAVGALVLAGFVYLELRRQEPMLDPRVFKNPCLTAGTLSIFVQFFAFFGFIFLVLQYLQLVRGDSPLTSAVSMLPIALTMMPTSRIAPMVVARVGSTVVCVTGLVLISGGLVILAGLDATSSYWRLLAGLVPLGVGMGAAMTPATSAITGALPGSRQGVGSALNDLSRELGGAVGIAVAGSALSSVYRSSFALPAIPQGQQAPLPADLIAKAHDSYAIAAHLGGPIAEAGNSAFVDGMRVALLICAGVTLTAAPLVVALLRNRRHLPSEPTADRDAHRHEV